MRYDPRAESDRESAVPIGTPVAIHPATPCGRCAQCLSGRENICAYATYLGSAASWPHTQGGFSSVCTVRAGQLRVLPKNLPLTRAVLAEPLSVALHALNRAGDISGKRVLVSGSGPIGLLVTHAAVLRGAAEVWACDVLERPLALARALGAWVSNRSRATMPRKDRYLRNNTAQNW